MNTKIKFTISVVALFIMFFATKYFLIPYAQKSVNSHTGGSDFFSILFNLIALILFIRLIIQFFKKASYLNILISLFYILTFVYLGYEFYNLFCYGCSQG